MIWGVEKTVSPEICFLVLLDQYAPGKWMPEKTQSDLGSKKPLRWDSLKSTCMLFDLEDSQAIIRETECFPSGKGCYMADKTSPKPKKVWTSAPAPIYKLWSILSFDNCAESFRWWMQVKPLCQTDAGTELLMALAANHLLTSKPAIASRPISMLHVKHELQVFAG